MGMTRRERLGRNQIVKVMSEQGYPTYASILQLFDLHLTKDPSVVGYMIPDEAVITVNKYLDIDQVSVVIRHEILHEFLEHRKRSDLAKIPMGQLMNIAADYEISNLGYTDKDKIAARSLKIGDKIVQGLVTDYDHPELVDKTFEEIYAALAKEAKENPGNGMPQIGDRGSKQIQDAEDAQRRAESIRDNADQAEQQAKQEMSGGSSDSGKGDKDIDISGSGSGNEGDDPQEEGTSNSNTSSGGSGSGKKHNKYDDDEYKNMSPEEKKKERARRRREAAKKIKEEADKVIDEIKDVLDDAKGKSKDSDKEVFDTPEEQAERAERISKIKEVLTDLKKMEEAKLESTTAIIREKAVGAEKNLKRFRQSGLTRFKESLNKFIRDSIARSRNSSWAHINKKYVYSGLLRPGYSSSAKGNVPLINVYFDRSGSWDDKTKTDKGFEAISVLKRYVTRGEITLKVYYFNDKVLDHDPGGNGGTRGQPILDHIAQTKPNNIVIMTDDDISDCRTNCEVPGAVWIMFYGGRRSENLIKHISGRQLTKVFDVE